MIETQPVITQPPVTEPVITQPVITQPVITEPPVTEPVITEPVITESVITEPVITELVITEPVITEQELQLQQHNVNNYNKKIVPVSDYIERIKIYKEQNPKTKVYILTPCFGSQCYINYVNSLIKTIDLFREVEIELCVEFCRNDSLVCRARNNMIARAMYDNAMTHIIFIDADISWNPVDILKMLLSEKDVVGGIYPLKKYNWAKILDNENSIKTILERREQGLMKDMTNVEDYLRHNLLHYNVNYLTEQMEIQNSMTKVMHIPTGFMMIKRDVIDKMMKSFPSTKYIDDVRYLQPEENEFAYALFDCGVEGGHYLSEDWMFCHRWRKMGGDIWMDISIPLTHTGIEDYTGFILSTLI